MQFKMGILKTIIVSCKQYTRIGAAVTANKYSI